MEEKKWNRNEKTPRQRVPMVEIRAPHFWLNRPKVNQWEWLDGMHKLFFTRQKKLLRNFSHFLLFLYCSYKMLWAKMALCKEIVIAVRRCESSKLKQLRVYFGFVYSVSFSKRNQQTEEKWIWNQFTFSMGNNVDRKRVGRMGKGKAQTRGVGKAISWSNIPLFNQIEWNAPLFPWTSVKWWRKITATTFNPLKINFTRSLKERAHGVVLTNVPISMWEWEREREQMRIIQAPNETER